MQNQSPVPAEERTAGQANPENVMEASVPMTHSGTEVEKVRYKDYGEGADKIRVVFDSRTGETLGVMRAY